MDQIQGVFVFGLGVPIWVPKISAFPCPNPCYVHITQQRSQSPSAGGGGVKLAMKGLLVECDPSQE